MTRRFCWNHIALVPCAPGESLCRACLKSQAVLELAMRIARDKAEAGMARMVRV